MTTITHGIVLPLESSESHPVTGLDPTLRAACRRNWPFGYMFPQLQADPANLLDESSTDIVKNLRWLGRDGMRDPELQKLPGVPIPSIYTFFGQFVDHDITLERGSKDVSLTSPEVIKPDDLTGKIVNSRSPDLDLDNVYGPDLENRFSPRDPTNPNKMLIGEVDNPPGSRGLPPGKDIYNDLPRGKDGKALIGDPRDDENVVIAQLHVAFLRAHNALVDRGLRFGEARKLLRQHYQWIVLDDFLERIADPNVVKRARYHGPRFFHPPPRSFFIPLEFSVAAYRFGHSKVRPRYTFNCIQAAPGINSSDDLNELFLNSGRRLAAEWVIDWTAFLDSENQDNFPRPIDPGITSQLLDLLGPQVGAGDQESNLAVRNLVRGYILRLPTGQAVADAMASQGVVRLTEKQILSWAVDVEYTEQIDILTKSGFLTRTPLWFYILAEAAYYSRGYHLGPVGSTIVAEVLIEVLRNSTDSILLDPHWRPTLGSMPGKFDVEDLLKLAGVF
jgi:hypothetical protein